MKAIYMCLTIIVLFWGCSNTTSSLKNASGNKDNVVSVNYLYIEGLDKIITDEIFILDFTSDDIGFSDSLYSEMIDVYLGDNNFFNVSKRGDLALVYKLNSKNDKRDTLDSQRYVINGEVRNNDIKLYKSKNSDGRKCFTYEYSATVDILLRTMTDDKIIFKDTLKDSYLTTKCDDYIIDEPMLFSNYSHLSGKIAKRVVDKFIPKKRIKSVSFLNTHDVYYSDEEKELLKKLINGWDKDKYLTRLLATKLVDSTNSYSAVALFNLALAYEGLRDLQTAKYYYQKAMYIALLNEIDTFVYLDNLNRINQIVKIMELK